MIVSSRTPEGSPHRCPICGKPVCVEPSDLGDATCPHCGHLLRWFRRYLAEKHGVSPEAITAESLFLEQLGADSLDTAELVMELEEEFSINIPDSDQAQIKTVGDAIRYIEEHLGSDQVDDWIPDYE